MFWKVRADVGLQSVSDVFSNCSYQNSVAIIFIWREFVIIEWLLDGC